MTLLVSWELCENSWYEHKRNDRNSVAEEKPQSDMPHMVLNLREPGSMPPESLQCGSVS